MKRWSKSLLLGLSMLAGLSLLAVYWVKGGETRREDIARGDAGGAFALARLEEDILAYDAFGLHRSGGKGDLATSDWLQTVFQVLGYRTQRLAFKVPGFEVESSLLKVGEITLTGVPQYPVTSTGLEGVSGYLVDSHAPLDQMRGNIVVVDIPASPRNNSLHQKALQEPVRTAAESGAVAVVLLLRAPCRTPKLLNTPLDIEPWTVPVLVLGERDAPTLQEAMATRLQAQLILEAEPVERQAFALVASLGPQDTAPIIISTPQSGWFHCAAERGSGLAVFLAIARWARSHPQQHFLFVANSGHERGNLGAQAFLDEVAPAPGTVAFWLHIGSNVGSTDSTGMQPNANRRLMTNWWLLPTVWRLFRNQPGYDTPYPLELGLAGGELRDYHKKGYTPLAGVFGPAPYHHCENDRPERVSLPAVRDAALSLAAILDSRTH